MFAWLAIVETIRSLAITLTKEYQGFLLFTFVNMIDTCPGR